MGGAGGEEEPCSNKEAEANFSQNREEGGSNQGDEEVSEKSLKKARYVWQIKGNYHLKCSGNEKERSTDSDCLQTELKGGAQVQPTNCHSSDSSEESDESEESYFSPSQSEPQTATSLPRYRPRPDWPVLKWQTRQVAKAFVDNTINCVLEDMGFVPLPADSVDILEEEFSAPQREQSDNSLEDKAVLMAIQSHGLQRSDQNHDSSFQHSSTNFQKNERRQYCPQSFSDLHHENADNHQSHSAGQTTSTDCSRPKILNMICPDHLDKVAHQGQSEIKCFSESSESRVRCQNESDHEAKKKQCFGSQKVQYHPKVYSDTACTCPVTRTSSSKQSESKSVENSVGSVSENQDSVVKCKSINDLNNSLSYPVVQSNPGHKSSSSAVPTKRSSDEVILTNDAKKRCVEPCVQYPETLSSVHLPACHGQASLVPGPADRSEGKLQSFEHFDFMDAAVVAAIQKKGLSALACNEYG